MGGGVSVDQSSVSASNAKTASKLVLGNKHWKDELRMYKLESVMIILERLGCRTNDDVANLPNHMWDEIKLKLKLLDQRRFNKLREKFISNQNVSTVDVSTDSNYYFPVATNSRDSLTITSMTANGEDDDFDFGVDLPVYPENNASYDVIVKQMVLIKDDLQHINELMGCGKYVTVIPFCLRNGLMQSKQLLIERLERCKARRAVLEAAKVAALKNNPRSGAGSPRKMSGSGRNSSNIRSRNNSSRCLSPVGTTSSNTGTTTPLKNRSLNREGSNVSISVEVSMTATTVSAMNANTITIATTPKSITFEDGVKLTSGNGTSTVVNYFNRVQLTRQNSF